MKVFKKYDSEKGRTTPILDVDGHSFGNYILDSLGG